MTDHLQAQAERDQAYADYNRAWAKLDIARKAFVEASDAVREALKELEHLKLRQDVTLIAIEPLEAEANRLSAELSDKQHAYEDALA